MQFLGEVIPFPLLRRRDLVRHLARRRQLLGGQHRLGEKRRRLGPGGRRHSPDHRDTAG